MPKRKIAAKQCETSNAAFVGSATVPAIALFGSAQLTLTVTPAVTGDVLTIADVVKAYAPTMPNGIMVTNAVVTGNNTVVLYLWTLVAVTLQTSPTQFTVVAPRWTVSSVL